MPVIQLAEPESGSWHKDAIGHACLSVFLLGEIISKLKTILKTLTSVLEVLVVKQLEYWPLAHSSVGRDRFVIHVHRS